MSKLTMFSLMAVFGVALAPIAHAQGSAGMGGNSYPADMAGVVMANVPADDLCQLDGNPVLTPEGQALVTAEIEGRPVVCGPVLAATNLAFLAPLVGVGLLAALAGGGDSGSTNNTQ